MLVCLPQYLRPWLLLRVFLPNFKAPSLPYLRHGNELTDIIVSLEHSSQFLRSGLLYYNGEELFQWESWKDHEIKISSIAPMKNCLSGTKQILCLPEFALFAGTAWWFLKSRLVSIESQRKKNCIAGGPEGIEVRRSVSTVTRKMQNSTVGLMKQSSFRRKFIFSRILRPSMFYKELVVFTENSSLSWEINC